MSTSGAKLDTGMYLQDLLSDEEFRLREEGPRARNRELTALRRLSHLFADAPEAVLQELVTTAVELCGADSAGISLEEPENGTFRWVAVAGSFERYLNGRTERHYSPCGTCLDAGRPQLYQLTKPFYDHLGVIAEPITDGLLIPWSNEFMKGTLWAVAHRSRENFSFSDYELLNSLADFASVILRNQYHQQQTKLALEESSKNKEQLELAIDASNLAVWHYDHTTRIVSGDEHMASFFGFAEPRGPAERWVSAILEEDRARVAEEFAAAIQGARYDTMYRVAVDGGVRWIHARARLLHNPDGSAYLTGICDDVTQERTLTESLAKSAARLSLAQQVSGATTFDWDFATDTVVWGSDCFMRPAASLRYSSDVFSLIVEADRQPLTEAISRAIASGKEYHCEFRVLAPDGDILWYQTSGSPLFDREGKACAMVGVNLNITQRKLAEEAVIQSEKLAAVGRMASSIAHEINNPLEAVTNLLYLAREHTGNPEVDEWLRQADMELRRVSAIANQTLRFHRQSSNAQPVTCLSLFSTTLDLYEARLLNNGISVEKRKRANEPVLCFEGDLRQVLSNVVVNAIDAMPRGGRLLVRSREGTDWRTGRKGLVLTIADTGAGMDSATRRRAFDAFYTTKGIGGSGLGLWISTQIVERHSGRFLLRSSSRSHFHGTTASIFIPFEGAKAQMVGS